MKMPPLAVFTHTDDWGQLERWSLLSLLSDCKYAVWTDAILRPDNYFQSCLEMPCLAVVSHGNVTTPACVLAFEHRCCVTATVQCEQTLESMSINLLRCLYGQRFVTYGHDRDTSLTAGCCCSSNNRDCYGAEWTISCHWGSHVASFW